MTSSSAPHGLPAPPPLGAAALPPGTYDGRLVLVTGGGTGLGRAIATEFARLGAALMIVSRRAEHLSPAREELAAVEGAGPVTAATCDIRDDGRVAEVFDRGRGGARPATGRRVSVPSWSARRRRSSAGPRRPTPGWRAGSSRRR